MQEIRNSNPPVVTGICDPNKSRARHHRSFKLGSKLKYLKISHSKNFKFREVSSLNCPDFTKICLFLFIPLVYPFLLKYPLGGNLIIYRRNVGSKWFINISINLKTKLLSMLISACAISYRLVECPYWWMKN